MGNLERSSNQLRELQAAFQRIAAGTFGVCIGCKETIGPKRLAAIPWASRFVCQECAGCEQKMSESEIDSGFVMAARGFGPRVADIGGRIQYLMSLGGEA